MARARLEDQGGLGGREAQQPIRRLAPVRDIVAMPTQEVLDVSAYLAQRDALANRALTSDPHVQAEERSRMVEPSANSLRGPLPYVALIRQAIERDNVAVARSLLAAAIEEHGYIGSLPMLHRLLVPSKITLKGASPTDRAAEYLWLSRHGHAYRGRWVAVSGDHLVAHASSLKEVLKQLAEDPPPIRPLIHRVV